MQQIKKTLSIFELEKSLFEIDAMISENTDEETGEILDDAKRQILNGIENKLENILTYKAHCDNQAEFYKEEKKRLEGKQKRLEKRSEFLKNLIFNYFKGQEISKKEVGAYTCTIVKNPPSVEILNENLIPEDCYVIKKELSKSILKDRIDETGNYRSQNGEWIATLKTTENLRIK